MKHISEDDLVLHYYGEGGGAIAHHLAECPECRGNFEQLSSTLSGITLPEPPPRGEAYGGEVWTRIRPKLRERETATAWWVFLRRWPAMAAVAALIAVAFIAGRYTNWPQGNPTDGGTSSRQLPQKVLVVALGDHLDRSEMLLVELTHANGPKDLDLNTQRLYARELVTSNRLYRQTAQRVGDAETAVLLDQLERVLLEVEHTPQDATAADIEQLREQINSGALLFKVRVAQQHIKADTKSNHSGTAKESTSLQNRRLTL